MSMFNRRLQVLIDDERLRRIEREAARRKVTVSVLVRSAIDDACPSPSQDRRRAAARILAARPMPVPEPAALRRELDALRGRKG
jgi:hypothetical protein